MDPIHSEETSVADLDLPDPHVFGPPGSGSFYHHAKIVRKTFIPYYFVTLFDFLSLKNYVNVPSKSTVISRKNCVKKLFFCWHLEGQ
jgi:hypothetical protein